MQTVNGLAFSQWLRCRAFLVQVDVRCPLPIAITAVSFLRTGKKATMPKFWQHLSIIWLNKACEGLKSGNEALSRESRAR